MPTRGYRKGVSDAKEPRPHLVRSRLTSGVYDRLTQESESRSLTMSSLIAAIVTAHVSGKHPELPHRNVDAALLRELARIGNNVNQVAHQANLMNLPVIVDKAEACLASLDNLLRRMCA